MPIINNPFNGKLNLDVAQYRISDGDYIDALNITKDSEGIGNDLVVANILGNTNIPYTLPAGENKVIGFYPDKVRDRAYYFLWNSNGYNSILYYNASTKAIVKVLESKTDSDGVDILSFNPSYKILSVNIYYRDVEGDILFFNDGLNPPRNINVAANYGTSWKSEYLLVIKAPPVMPAKVTYINDNNVTVNNLRNKLFQFSYRYVYDNNEKSVWSTKSIVPLPQQPTLQLTEDIFKNNSAISISVSTGGVNVQKIELSFRETTSGFTSDWYLITQIDKTIAGILDNDIYTFNFYNDSIYTQIDVTDTTQLQDWVPQKANAAELANGNVLLYSGITEGYDKTDVILQPQTTNDSTGFFVDNAGLLFFAACNGLDSGSVGTVMKVYVYGTISDIPPVTSTTTTTIPPGTTTTTTISPAVNFYLATARRRCDTGVQRAVRIYVNFTNNSYTPIVGKWYKDNGCPTYSYQITSVTVYNSVVGGATLQTTDYATGDLACVCLTTTTTIAGITSTTTTTTIAPSQGLNNPAGIYVINAQSAAGADIGISYTVNSATYLPVATLLSGIRSSLLAKGWTSVTILNNVLTATFASGFTLFSSGVKYLAPVGVPDNTSFANASKSGYQYAIQYFDAQGRTIGAQTDKDNNGAFNTPDAIDGIRFCQTYLNIYNTPPLEAMYYQVLRSNNTTYNKRLFWISESTFTSPHVDEDPYDTRYAYIDVKNIQEYNILISSTQNIVSYTFTAGDRIRFLSRYSVTGEEIPVVNLDCEILGMVYTITTNDGTKEGNFIKINYPTEFINVNPTFQFDTEEYWHYKIFIYNLSANTSDSLRVFYEFGKCFGIGNPGTANAYHIGLEHTQSAEAGPNHYATISGTNGDLFYRKRNVLYNNQYKFLGEGQESAAASIDVPLKIICQNGGVDNASYSIQTQNFDTRVVTTSDTQFFYNKSSINSITIQVRCAFGASSAAPINFNGFAVYLLYATPYDINPRGGKTKYVQLGQTAFLNETATIINIDENVSIPRLAKVWIIITGAALFNSGVTISSFDFNFSVVFNNIIPIIEQSFSDNYNLVTNSNGRPSVIDENAAKRYFPTLIRFGQAYQFNTNINGTNRFFYENFDEYDRSFGDVIRLHVRDRYLKVYQKFKVGNVPILTQIVKDSANNPLQANTDTLINKIQYYAGDYGIGDAATSLAWNNFADYFVDNYRGVVCRLSQDGITPISIINKMNAFFVATLSAYRQELNNGVVETGVYMGNPCIYGVFDAYTNKYIIAMEEINRYVTSTTTTTAGPTTTTTTSTTTTTTSGPTTTTTTTSGPTTTTTTTTNGSTTTTTQIPVWYYLYNCSTGGIETSASFPNGTFIVNQRVVYGGSLFFYVTQVVFADPGGTQWSISSAGAGLEFCPATTTTTTISPVVYAYYVAQRCDNPAFEQYFRTVSSYSVGISLRYNGFCWEIQALQGASGVDPDSSHIDCIACNASYPTTTTTTLPPTTTTTTQPPVWYYLYNCSTGAIETSATYPNGTFIVNQRVVYGGSLFFYVTQVVFADPGGIQWSVSSAGAGLTFCPATTTTTTAAPLVYSYYVATRCDNPSLQQYFRTTGSYVAGISVRYQGFCWEIQSLQGASGFDPESSHISCASCYATYPTTTTTSTTTAAPTTTTTTLPPTTTTTTQPQVWYYLYNCSTGGIETSASFLNGTFAINQRVVYGGSLFFYVTQVVFSNPGGTQWSVSSAGAGLTFCPATTTTTTVPPIVTSYYVATRCDNPSLQQYFQTTGSYSAGISVRYQGFCWEIQAQAGASGVNPESSHINCASCYATYPTTSTTTTTTAAPTTTTTTAAPISYNVTNLIQGITSQQPSQDYYEYYPNATIFINQAFGFDINFVVESSVGYLGIQYIPVTILAGTTNGFGDVGPFSGTETSPSLDGACIFSCDQPSITLGIYAC